MGGIQYHFVIGARNGGTGTAVLNLDFVPGLAHVSIAANAKTVYFSKSHQLVYTVSTSGSFSKKVKVNYKTKLAEGIYSNTQMGTKKIKPGKPSTSLVLTFNFLSSSQASIKVFLLPGVGYVVDGRATAKATILDK